MRRINRWTEISFPFLFDGTNIDTQSASYDEVEARRDTGIKIHD